MGAEVSTSEVLNKAADLIEQRGWTTGDEGWDWHLNETAPLCLEGGILAATGMKMTPGDYKKFKSCPAYRAVHDYLTGTGDLRPDRALWWFNDDHDANRVIRVLRATALIEAARERESVEV